MMDQRIQPGQSFERPAPDETLPDRLIRIARLHNRRLALVSATWRPTYGELDAACDRQARAIAARGGNPGDRVVILMRQDSPQIAAVLAALKAGRIVVVLNPTDAPARLRLTVEDAAPTLIIADGSHMRLAEQIAGSCARVRCDELAQADDEAPMPRVDAQATAFIVYTSGSAGRPKGVMMNHQQIIHNALRLSSAMGLSPVDTVALLPSLSGLHGVNNLWCALVHGALLQPFPVMERGVTGLAEWMMEHAITAFSASTSLFRSFMKSMRPGKCIPSVKALRVGGELVTSDDFAAFKEHFSPDCILVNTLASSEAGNITYLRLCGRDTVPKGSLAVGRTFAGMEIEIKDEHDRPVAPGEAGQIIVKSRYMSQGYWRDPAQTAARYFHDADGKPAFRSGDWGRIKADGVLEFAGRRDTRVKIHGSSVELDEIEQALCGVAEVERAVVCAFEGPYGTQLAAYVVPRDGRVLSSSLLRRSVRSLLPEHMVPAIFQILDDLPLMPHGKVDRTKLLQSRPPIARQRSFVACETPTEVKLAAVWAEAFDLSEVGRDDNFFELGGDSLIASLVAARVYSETGAELDLDSFARHPTVAALAAVIDQSQDRRNLFQISPVLRERRLPLSFTQQRIWDISRANSSVMGYVISVPYRIGGPLDVGLLRACMNRLAARHEMLRTTFEATDDGPAQIVHPPGEVSLIFHDFTTAANPIAAADELMAQHAAQPMDLRQGPLLRFTLVRIGENEHRLLRVIHHILYDATSWTMYMDELALLYEAAVQGKEPQLPDAGRLQYADYASWQRDFFRADAPACRNMIAWWKTALDAPPEPFDWPPRRPQLAHGVDPAEGELYTGIEGATWQRMAALARQQNATPFVVWLAAFGAFLAAETGRADIIIGTYVSNRKRPELQNMFGDFSNLVTLRLRCELDKTLRTCVMTTREAFMSTMAFSEMPYEELRRSFERDGRNLPAIQRIFLTDSPERPLRFGGIELSMQRSGRPSAMPWGFTFRLMLSRCDCQFAFDASIYDPAAVRATARRWRGFVGALSLHPDTPMARALAMTHG